MICTVFRELRAGSLLLFALGVCLAVPARGQADRAPSATKTENATSVDYEIGPGDVLAISVSDAPEFTGKFRVTHSGQLDMSSLPSPVQAQGKTPKQLAQDIARALVDARLYRNPNVNVYVDEYHARNVTVVGAVAKPAVYALQKQTTVLEMISQAGGLLPTAGNKVTISSSAAPEGAAGTSFHPAQQIDLAKLVRGEDPALNVEVHDGDVVSVAQAEVVYVVGAVVKPGGFVLPDQSSGVTALQALAMAEGTTSVASKGRALIIRRPAKGPDQESIPIDVGTLLTGKSPDVKLQANDILFIPVSGAKQSLFVLRDVAVSAANGIAIYGAGYRVAGIR